MRNPNGYGSVKRLSGNRRRPYIFVVSEAGKRRVIGYYATQVEALIAQTDYNIHHNHPRLRDNKMTFAEGNGSFLLPIQKKAVSGNSIGRSIQ